MAAGVTNLRPRITHKHSNRKLYMKPLPRNAYLSGRLTSQLRGENVTVTFKRLSCPVKICNNLVSELLSQRHSGRRRLRVEGRIAGSILNLETTVVTADKEWFSILDVEYEAKYDTSYEVACHIMPE